MTRARDNQRQRVYDAERSLPDFWCQTIPNDRLQAEVDRILDLRVVRSRWGYVKATATLTHGGARTGYSDMRFGRDTRNSTVICHEIAHVLVGRTHHNAAGHGPEFAGVYLFLLEHAVSKDRADTLRAAFKANRVRVSRAGIPAVLGTLHPSAAQRQVVERAARRAPLHDSETATLARLLRRAVNSGAFGAPGTAGREKALATARTVEKGLTA